MFGALPTPLSQSSSSSRRAHLAGYSQPKSWRRIWTERLLFAALLGLVFLLAAFVALTGTSGLRLALAPIAILALLVIWALPDDVREPRSPAMLTAVYVTASLVWPTYVAFTAGALPWITPARLIFPFLALSVLMLYSTSPLARDRFRRALTSSRAAFVALGIFWAWQFVTLPMSSQPIASASAVLTSLTFNIPLFLAGIFIAYDPNTTLRTLKVLIAAAAALMVIAVLEQLLQRPPWAGFLPPFLRIDPELLNTFLSPQARMGDKRYRVRSTYPIVLYYAQFLCIVFPLVLHWIVTRWRRAPAASAVLAALALHSAWFVNARTALIGLIIAVTSTFTYVVIHYGRSGRDALIKPLLACFFIVAITGAIGTISTSHRAQMYTIGGAQHAASNKTRDVQWANAFEQIGSNPFGAGAGTAAELVGTRTPDGRAILDSSYINIMSDFGVIGIVSFFFFIVAIIVAGLRSGWRSTRDAKAQDAIWLFPISASLVGYLFSMYSVSYDRNFFLLYLLCGIVLGVRARLASERNVPMGNSQFLRQVERPGASEAGP